MSSLPRDPTLEVLDGSRALTVTASLDGALLFSRILGEERGARVTWGPSARADLPCELAGAVALAGLQTLVSADERGFELHLPPGLTAELEGEDGLTLELTGRLEPHRLPRDCRVRLPLGAAALELASSAPARPLPGGRPWSVGSRAGGAALAAIALHALAAVLICSGSAQGTLRQSRLASEPRPRPPQRLATVSPPPASRRSHQGLYLLRGPRCNRDPHLARRLPSLVDLPPLPTFVGGPGVEPRETQGEAGLRLLGYRTLLRDEPAGDADTCGLGDLAAGRRAGATGHLDKEVIRRVIREQVVPMIRHCFAQEPPPHDNHALLRFVITPRGSVSRVEVLASNYGERHHAAEACVIRAFEAARYPASSGGGRVVVTYPLQLFVRSGSGGGD